MNPKKPRNNCLACGKECKQAVDKFCNNRCQNEYQNREYIERWLRGEETGYSGVFFTITRAVRRWVKERDGEKCSRCGWAKRHLLTGQIPVTIDHIDGDVSQLPRAYRYVRHTQSRQRKAPKSQGRIFDTL